MSWDPAKYLQYEDARLRPALDLLARVPLAAAAEVVDLGCGAGNVARWLARRWPEAAIEGVDGDRAMLEKARQATAGDARFRWTLCDLADWRPTQAPDVLYSNAALHWIDGHAALFPRLALAVRAGGVLAVQMPHNFDAPSHRELFDVVRADRWRAHLGPLVREHPVAPPADYYDWLSPHVRSVDVWTTEYLQRLPAIDGAEHPVVAWMRGAALVPFVAALSQDDRQRFVDDYAARIERAYPRRADGNVMFPFRRLFIVATR